MSHFGRSGGGGASRSNKPGLQALKRLIDMTTLISPTQGGFHKPSAGAGNTIVTYDKLADRADAGFLVVTPVVDRHFRRLYDSLRGRDPLLARARLAAFLEDTQGECRPAGPLEKERYRFEEFLEVWWHRYGWGALRPPVPEQAVLSMPLSNYFISSSHNTYLDGDQYFSNSCADMYRKVCATDVTPIGPVQGC